VNGIAPLSDWPEDGELENFVPADVPPLPLSQPVLEIPILFWNTIEGESRVPAFARLAELPALTGMEGMSVRATYADSESPLLMSTRVLSTGPHPVPLSETLPVSRNSWTDTDLVHLSQKFRPIRLAALDKSETVTPWRRKRTEVEMLTH
jgi:hypothetical protein